MGQERVQVTALPAPITRQTETGIMRGYDGQIVSLSVDGAVKWSKWVKYHALLPFSRSYEKRLANALQNANKRAQNARRRLGYSV